MALSVRNNDLAAGKNGTNGTAALSGKVDAAEYKLPRPHDSNRVVVIIPAYNEERFVGSVVLKTLRYAGTVLVVDDGSTDSTAEIAAAAGAEVIRHPQNLGKGGALNTGFCRARELHPDVVVTIDADGQHFPEDLPAVIAPILEQRAEIVVGSRYIRRTGDVPRHRVMGHAVFNSVTNRLSGVPVTDSQSGFRAFAPSALKAISFASQGFAVESEMQFLAREHDLRLIEVPITIKYLDRPKRSVVAHGLMVLNGILGLVGQHRPLLYFGLPGLLLQVAGLLWAARLVESQRTLEYLPIGPALISALLLILGTLGFFTGLILHSVRGLLLTMLKARSER